jgi:transcriptional regulator GlxA family with amidase domain
VGYQPALDKCPNALGFELRVDVCGRKHADRGLTNWLLAQRIALAQRLLETSDRNIDSVANNSGFASAVSLRRHLTTAFWIPPTAYRKQFRSGGPRSH